MTRMALLLSLRRQVAIPTLWLDEREWKGSFRDNIPWLGRFMDGSPETVLTDMGGFESLVEGAAWSPGLERRCTGCNELLPLDRFGFVHGSGSWPIVDSRCRLCRNTRVRNRHNQVLMMAGS